MQTNDRSESHCGIKESGQGFRTTLFREERIGFILQFLPFAAARVFDQFAAVKNMFQLHAHVSHMQRQDTDVATALLGKWPFGVCFFGYSLAVLQYV